MNRATVSKQFICPRRAVQLLIIAVLVLALTAYVAPTAAQDSTRTHTVQAGENLYRIALQYGLTVADLIASNDIPDPTRIFAGQVLTIPLSAPVSEEMLHNAAVNPAPDASVYHTVQPGEALTSIAQDYGLSWLDLAAANGLGDPGHIITGQRLLIPSAAAADTTEAAEAWVAIPLDEFGIQDQVAAINPAPGALHQSAPAADAGSAANTTSDIPDQVAAVEPVPSVTDLGILPAEPAPAPAQQAAAPPAPGPNDRTHIVRAGEHLAGIAAQYGLSYTALVTANNITDPNHIFSGQRLIIPGQGNAPAPAQQAAAPAPSSGERTHVVQAGEHLASIAAQYGLSYPTLAMANNISNPNHIFSGQQLIIPAQDYAPGSYVPQQAAAPPAAAPTITTGKQVVVDLSDQRVYAYEDGVLLRNVLVSTGTAAFPTVQGNYKVYLKYESQTMSGPGYNLPGVPYVLYFYKGYSLHGTYWHNNFGTPMSHGCVNMPTPEAQWLFNWAPIGTPVRVQW